VEITAGFGKAREAAERALQSEPDLAEGHAALGQIRMWHDWDWDGADESLRRALELAPGDAQVIRDTGVLAGNLGRSEEALALVRRAVALDPLSAPAHRSLARLCVLADLLDEAEAAGQKALELNPKGGFTHFWLGLVRLGQGRLDEALEIVQRETHETFRLLGLTLVQHARRRPAESDAALQELIEKNAAGAAHQIAEAYAYRGETDLAFEWLERAYAQRDTGVAIMKVSPPLRNLHGDPRWQPFLEKMGLAD
ncbi:MAG TPA: tetratricopeptide repeat protein, partial [Casimicrobiaceae bacterium]